MSKFVNSLRNFIVEARHIVYRDIARLPFVRRIDNNKLYATGFFGMKYGDNPAYILEKVKELRPQTRIIWPKHHGAEFKVPSYVETVRENSFADFYHMLTAKVLVNSHDWSKYYVKDKRQFLLNTWHGGLGIKKIAMDNKRLQKYADMDKRLRKRFAPSDLMVSNSEHLSRVYRGAFKYCGPIWNCGYPKTDLLYGDRCEARATLRRELGLNDDVKLMLYAPTFRMYLNEPAFKDSNPYPYSMDFNRLRGVLEKRFGGEWRILVRKHPAMNEDFNQGCGVREVGKGDYSDVTNLPDIQKLLMGCDACISDFSSVIFDAALLRMPCFTYASDEEYYTKDIGVYYHLAELPFPTAGDNDALEIAVASFNDDDYQGKLDNFLTETVGLHETGHATEDIAQLVCNILDGKPGEIQNVSMQI